ncbi:putative selenium-dependent hydroxylase accessory protein YqeC [Fretibacterium sp. OH1220_COT-178]|nr:putative selenium-dependent hydroxylase accessory protein YqeC [Fretibacterium sp. OH1220_COT-178]
MGGIGMMSTLQGPEAFFAPFGLGGRELVSLVGGGGKTTLLRTLGQVLARRGTVLLTTTTKMAAGDGPLLLTGEEPAAEGVERIRRALRSQSPLTTAQRHVRDGNREKLEGLLPGAVDRLWEAGAADFVVCEADGARHKPLKAWADWEPPIPGRTTVLCAVLGADRLDEPLTEAHVHRMDRMTEDFGFRPGDPLTPERLAALLESPRGYLKNAPPTPNARRFLLMNRSDLLPAPRAEALARDFLPRLTRALRSWDLLILGSLHALRHDAVLRPERTR